MSECRWCSVDPCCCLSNGTGDRIIDTLPDFEGPYIVDDKPALPWHLAAWFLIAADRPIEIIGAVCSSQGCSFLAAFRTWWPSPEGSQIKCPRCTDRACTIAAAMGFTLKVEPIEGWYRRLVPIECPSSLRFSLMELD